MTPPTTLLDRVRLRWRSRRQLEADRDAAEAQALGWQRQLLVERAAHGRTRDLIAQALGILTGPGIEVDVDALVEVVRAVRERARLAERDRTWVGRLDQAIADAQRVLRTAGHGIGDETTIGDDVARALGAERDRRDELDHQLEEVRDELRATGHPIGTRGLSYDVDAAIDRERCRAQDVVERLADALGQAQHAIWPHSAPRLLREVARLTGRSISTRRVRPSDWPAGSFMARQLACTCRGSVAGSGSSVVDSQCAEHSPGYRFGGRPVQPLALPSATARSWTGEPVQPVDDDVVDTQIVDALDRWEGDATSGGWVCDACGRPVDELPCPEHQPLALADARAEADGVPF